jgi:hypothetical protein
MEARIFAGMHPARKIDAWHHREISDDFTFAGDSQRIFII